MSGSGLVKKDYEWPGVFFIMRGLGLDDSRIQLCARDSRFYDEKKCTRKTIKILYFEDQKYDV